MENCYRAFEHCVISLVVAAVLIGVGCAGNSKDQEPQNANEAVQSPVDQKPQIAYQVVEEWNIPNGGYGRVIVIDSTHRNETDLLKLADQLNNFTRQDRHAVIDIYDNEAAALMRRDAFQKNLSKKDLAFHDLHVIGFYNRNINTGYHAITITLKGIMGPAKEVAL